MSDFAAVRLTQPAFTECRSLPAMIRRLPDGEFRQAVQLGIEGRHLRIDVPGPKLAPGTLVEIESGAMLYLGEVQQQNAPIYSVFVEHCVDRAKLDAIRELWN
jgi:hypothetical protein